MQRLVIINKRTNYAKLCNVYSDIVSNIAINVGLFTDLLYATIIYTIICHVTYHSKQLKTHSIWEILIIHDKVMYE